MNAVPPMPSADPAFPHETERSSPSGAGVWTEIFHGLSRREWFAGQALHCFAVEALRNVEGPEAADMEQIAAWAFSLADAMIAESEKEQQT